MQTSRLLLVGALALATVLLAAPSPAGAATLTVCASGCGFTTIQAAVNAAASGDTIGVVGGTYNEAVTIPNGMPLTIVGSNGATMDGTGLNGPLISDLYGPGSETLSLESLTFQNDNYTAVETGGDLTIESCTFKNNVIPSGTGILGAVYANGPVTTIIDSTFTGNSGTYAGALDVGGVLNVVGSTFNDNSGGYLGVAIDDEYGTEASISASTFSGNTGGAAIYAGQSGTKDSATLSGDTFTNNSNSGGDGGALSGADAAITVIASTFRGNTSEAGGAMACCSSGGSVNIIGSTLTGNSTVGTGASGGGALFGSGPFFITNSTLTGNHADLQSGASGGQSGGAIWADGVMTLTNDTIVGNTALGGFGGGIRTDNGATSTVVTNTVLAGNTASRALDCIAPGAPLISNHSLFGVLDSNCSGPAAGQNGTLAGTPNQPLSPGLGPLAANGGPVQTMLPQSGSPVIGSADPAVCQDSSQLTAPHGLDARDYLRPTAACDMGAADSGGTPPSGPGITAVSPQSLPTGSPDTPLVLTGAGFDATSVVGWNGMTLPTSVISADQLQATIPANLLATPGTGFLSVADGALHSNTLPLYVTGVATPILDADAAFTTTGAATVSVGGSGPDSTGSITSAAGPGAALAAGPTAPSGIATALYAGDPAPSGSDAGWQLVSDLGAPDGTGCVTATITQTTTPSLADLAGAWFRTGHGIAARHGASTAASPYFDVSLTPGNSFGQVLIKDCAMNGAADIFWYHPFEEPLAAGWTLLDVPVQSGVTTLGGLVGSLDGSVGAGTVREAVVYHAGQEQVYVPDYSADLTLGSSDGVAVDLAAGGVWQLVGTAYTGGVQVTFTPGWNLIAVPWTSSGSLTASGLASAASACGVKAVAVESGGAMHTWTSGSQLALNLTATEGVWVQCAGSGSWTPQ